MFETWFSADPAQLLMVALSAVGIYVAVILFTRMSGLRSFAKMSSFDFAMTVAIGSLVASTLLTSNPPLLAGVVGLASIYILQEAVAWARRFEWVKTIVDNTPVLVMRDGEILHDNLRSTEMTEGDLRSKLRENNVFHLHHVRAVILETTGDVSVMVTSDDDLDLDEWLLEGVKDAERSHEAAGRRAPSAPSAH